jgi:hypothetical protein
MLPQTTTKKFAILIMATLMSVGSLSLMPLEVFASHSFEAGVSGDNIPDNTFVDLSGLELPPFGVMPLYDASPNFISGHFLLKAPCDTSAKEKSDPPESYTPQPLVTAIAGHIDESTEMTHVEPIPLYFIAHASPPTKTALQSCVYHAHIPDPLNGGSPRNTDVDLFNCSGDEVIFNQGDAVDMNVQRTLGSIEDFYEGEMLLPSCDPPFQFNQVFNLNDDDPTNDGLGHED